LEKHAERIEEEGWRWKIDLSALAMSRPGGLANPFHNHIRDIRLTADGG
jgi:hypothetical protein